MKRQKMEQRVGTGRLQAAQSSSSNSTLEKAVFAQGSAVVAERQTELKKEQPGIKDTSNLLQLSRGRW